MAQEQPVEYRDNSILIKRLPKKGENVQVFVRPNDTIDFPVDLSKATYQVVGGDVIVKLPEGGTLTFVSMGLIAFTDNSLTLRFPSYRIGLEDILAQTDSIKEAPVQSVITDEFVALEEESSENVGKSDTKENQNFSQIVAQTPQEQVDTPQPQELQEIQRRLLEEIDQNDFDAVYKPMDDNPVNVNISEVNNAVEAGLKYSFTAYQTAAFEADGAIQGGGGSAYGASVDTPEAQFQPETLDFSQQSDPITIFADSPKLFKTDPNDPNSAAQLARDISIKPEQPIGFGISAISISNLPDGFKIVGASYKNGVWEIQKSTDGTVLTGFVVDKNTGKARFTLIYPADLPEGEDIVAVINFTSTFSTDNLLPGESVDTPDITSLSGQGRLPMVTRLIDWEDPNGFEGFADGEGRVVLATNPNNNVIFASHGDSTIYGGEGKDTVTAYEGNDTIFGGGNDDTLAGGSGDDLLFGDFGNDTLIGQEGVNTLEGGDGIDTVEYTYVTDIAGVDVDLSLHRGENAAQNVHDTLIDIERVVGSDRNDRIRGDYRNNILLGEKGNDTLYGGLGDDTLQGGDNDDVLYGEAGDDTLFGDAHNDTLLGGDGDDTIEGGSGDDTIFYDLGTDIIDGGLGSDTLDFALFSGGVVASIYQGDVTIANSSQNDTMTQIEILNGSADDDTLTGGSDANTLYGDAGDDTLVGNEGNDILEGGSGDDFIKGGDDIDAISGGSGNDTLLGGAGADKLDGGTGIDTADYTNEGAIYTTLNQGSYVAVNVSGGDSDQIRNIENIKGSNTGSDSIVGDALVNVLQGQGGNDILDGAQGDDTLLGGDGDDTLRGGYGNDTLIGGVGSDTADYTNEGKVIVDLSVSQTVTIVNAGATDSDTLIGIQNITGSNTNDDELTGDAANNTLKGLDGEDTLVGKEGDDYLDGGLANDTLIGGADQDTLKGSFGDDYLEGGSGNDILEGGSGNDTVSYTHAANGVKVALDSGTATGEGVDSLLDIENVVGSAYSDTLVGNSAINTLFGGEGDDSLEGGKQNDTLFGEDGDDTLRGGEGVDRLYGGNATIDASLNDTASYVDVGSGIGIDVDLTRANTTTADAIVQNDGYNGVDYLYGIENVQGSNFNDRIFGDSGDNTLLGEGGTDSLYGDAGDDFLDGGSGDDTLRGGSGNDIIRGGYGSDTADYSQVGASINVDMRIASGFNVLDDGEGSQDILAGVENVIGSAFGDTIRGDTTNNMFYGGDGDDTLQGGSGLDTLYGGSGNDTFFGGADSDYIDGGSANGDTADAHDIVDYSDMTSNGVVVDLGAHSASGDGNDVIYNIEDIRGSAFSDTLRGDGGVNTIYAGAGDDILVGGSALYQSNDDDLLYGEEGDDTLRGDGGVDTLVGGDGVSDNGSDTADYSTVVNATQTGIDVDLSRTQTVGDATTYRVQEDGYGTQDRLEGIENIAGSEYDDRIKGSDDASELNTLIGNGGDDSFIVSDGQDSIVGSDGIDTIDYSTLQNAANTGIVLDFDVLGEEKSIVKTTTNGTFVDLVRTVERVIGTDYDDTFVGGSGNDEFFGGAANDTFTGNSGSDTLHGGSQDDYLNGGADDDTLYGDTGNDTLVGGLGDDYLDGGTHTGDRDVVDYTASGSKISLDLANNRVIGADSGVDTIVNIEAILATNYEDTLVGDDASNFIDGRGANDTLIGGGGDDTLIGYNGGDTINGGLGNDVLIGGSDLNDKDTVGFHEINVGGVGIADVNGTVRVDLATSNAAVIAIERTDTTVATTYSFDITDANGTVTTISYTAQSGDTGDTVIAKLYDAFVSATIPDIKVLNDTSNSPNIDVYETSHRLLLMDTSPTHDGFSVTNVNALVYTAAGTALSTNALTSVEEIDYLFDFDNIIGSDIQGANRGDTLTGNDSDNTIYALSGDDTIFSTAGADFIDGGNDTKSALNVGGGDWIDYSLHTTRANVVLDAGNGDATGSDNFNNTLKNIENIRGTNAVAGDTLIGDDGDNIIEGGDNNNNADNNNNRDTLIGGGGNDVLYGQGGRDVLSGGSGNDTLYGGAQSDTLYGGSGVDHYDGGSGYDVVDYWNTAILLDMQTTSRTDADGDDYTTTFTDIEEIYGSDGNDEIIVTGAMNISARGGNDVLVGGAGASRIYGGDGSDLIFGGEGADVLLGGNQNDTFFASLGSDTIDGGDYTDTIDFRNDRTYTAKDALVRSIGTNVTQGIEIDLSLTVDTDGNGIADYGLIANNGFGETGYIRNVENVEATDFNDTVTGNGGKNIINLYGGDDTLFVGDGGDTVDAGSGEDWIDASNATSGGALYLEWEVDYIGSPSGKIYNFEHIRASNFDDYMLQGSDGDNTILALAGDDTLVGRAGNDYLDGGSGNDVASYSESSGASTASIVVRFDTAMQTVADGFGSIDTLVNIETVIGSAYNDTFYGSSTNDTFLSGGGQDSFIASLGDDYLSGNEGGVAASTVDYGLLASGSKLILDLDAASDQGRVVNATSGTKIFTDTLVSIKNVVATDENDTLTGSSADNSIYARGGDDTFIATDGNDTYDGGSEINGDWVDYGTAATDIISDLLSGSTSKGINGSSDGLNSIEHIVTGSGDDTVTASTADNTVIANGGNDTIYSHRGDNVFYADDATDVTTNDGIWDTIRYDIEDTGSGVHVNIDTSAHLGISANSALNAYGGNDTLYNFENIVGSANGDTLIGNDSANSINGGAGADTIVGGAGADRLVGGTGNDVFIMTNGEFGNDAKIRGGDDNDTITITDQVAITDIDFVNIQTVEYLLFSGDFAHTATLGSNADASGIVAIDATAALSANVAIDIAATTNDLNIQTSNANDSIVLGGGTNIVASYDGDDVVVYKDTNSVDNALSSASDSIDAGSGNDTLFADSAQDYDFTQAELKNFEELRFFQGSADQTITITSDANTMFQTYVANASQNNMLAIETTVSSVDVDLTNGKTISGIEQTVITSNFNINATLIGNAATQDTIFGSNAADVISALGQNDVLSGGGGNDTFLDGSGVDYIDGGSGDDIIEFSTGNLDATDGNDTVIGGSGNDTLRILDRVTTTNVTDALLKNVTQIETIAFGNFANDIALNQDGVLLQGGNVTDIFRYGNGDFDANDMLEGGGGEDTLIIGTTESVVKSLQDFAGVSNIETFSSGSGNDTLDFSGGSNGFSAILLNGGDDTLSIDANNVWSNKTLDGGSGSDTLSILGSVSVDLSATTVVGFENMNAGNDLSLTVKQINALTSIDIGTNDLHVVGNEGENSFSASSITASKIVLGSAMQLDTTIDDVHMDVDASAANVSIVVNIGASTPKTVSIQGGGGSSDTVNLTLASGESITNALQIDGAIENCNVTIADSHTLDVSNVASDITLQSAASTTAQTVTLTGASATIDASALNASETLHVYLDTSAFAVIGGASTNDAVFVSSASDTLGSIVGIEIVNVADSNANLQGKINSDVSRINIASGKTLTLAASDLHTNTVTVDTGTLRFSAGSAGGNDYANVTLINGASLHMNVLADLDIATYGSDDITPVTQVDVALGKTLRVNADQVDSSLDVNGLGTTSQTIFVSTTTDANNVFDGIVNIGNGSLVYEVRNNVDKTGKGSGVFGDIDTFDVTSSATLRVDAAQLGKITTLKGDATLSVVGDGQVDLSAINGTFSGSVLISDVAAAETIVGSNFRDIVTIDAGSGDGIYSRGGDDTIALSQNADVIDGGSGNDTIFLETSGLDLSTTALTDIETIRFTVGSAAQVTMRSVDINTIAVVGESTPTNTIFVSDTGIIDLSGAVLSDIEEIVFNDSAVNTVTADLDGVRLALGDSGDTLRIATNTFSSADTIVGGSGVDTIALTNGGSVVDSAFTNVSGIERIVFSDNATALTLGTQAGTIATIVGGNAVDTLTLTGGGSYTTVGGIENLIVDKTIDLSGKITDVTHISVTSSGVLTLDANDFAASITIDNDGSLTLNNAKTATMAFVDLSGSGGTTTINVAAGETIDLTSSVLAGTVHIKGSASANETIIVDTAVASIDGVGGSNDLVIAAGSSNNFSATAITNIRRLQVDESVDLSGTFDNTLAIIDVAATKTLTIASSDIDGDTIDLSGNGTTYVRSDGVGRLDLSAITKSGSGELVVYVGSDTDITSDVSDTIAIADRLSIGSGVSMTMLASQTDASLVVEVVSASASCVIVSTSVDSQNVFTNITKNGSGTLTYSVVNDVDKTGEGSGVLGAIDTVAVSATNTLRVDANQIGSITTLEGDGTFYIVSVGGTTDASALTGGFTGTLRIDDSSGVDVIVGSDFSETVYVSSGASETISTNGGGDTIVYSDANFDGTDTIDGGAGIDTLQIVDAADLTVSDLSNVSSVEILQLADATNVVDLSSASIQTLFGGSGSDTITAQGDENMIATGGGDDRVVIDAVVIGTVDGGTNTAAGDTLEVIGNLDLTNASISGFENIVTNDSITLTARQADGVSIQIGSNKVLTIGKNDTASNTHATLQAANITRVDATGKLVIAGGLGAALAISALAIDLDATNANRNISVETSDGSIDIIGASSTSVTTDVTYSANVTVTGTLQNIDKITANSGATLDATLLDNQTLTIDTSASVIINATALASDHDFGNIVQTGSGEIVLYVAADVDLSGRNIAVIDRFDIATGVTLTLDAAQLSGKTVTGSATIQANNLDAAPNADFSNVAASVTLNVDWSGTATYSGNLSNVDRLTISSGTMHVDGAIIDGKTIDGSGTLDIISGGDGNLDLSNVDASVTVAIGDTATTLANIGVGIDASSTTKDLTYVLQDIDGLTVTTGSGANTIDASALSDARSVIVEGDDAVSVTVSNGDVNALNVNANVSVNAGSGSNVIVTGSGDDTIYGGSGGDTLSGGLGNDVFVFTLGDETGDTIDGGGGIDTILTQGSGSFDFSNILASIEEIDMSDSGAQTVQIDAATADTALSGVVADATSGADTVRIDTTSDIDLSDNVTTITNSVTFEYNVLGGASVVGTTAADRFTIDFGNLANGKTLDGVSDNQNDTVLLVGTNTTNTIASSEFANIAVLDLTGLDTNDSLDITFNDLDNWKESGAIEFTIDVNDDGSGNIVTGQQFNRIDNSGTTAITTLGDYTFSDGTNSITLHVI